MFNGEYLKIPVCNNQLECSLEEYESWSQSVELEDPNVECGVYE